MVGEALVVGPRGEILARYPQLAALGPWAHGTIRSPTSGAPRRSPAPTRNGSAGQCELFPRPLTPEGLGRHAAGMTGKPRHPGRAEGMSPGPINADASGRGGGVE